jgi:hypothetical protein
VILIIAEANDHEEQLSASSNFRYCLLALVLLALTVLREMPEGMKLFESEREVGVHLCMIRSIMPNHEEISRCTS